MGHNQIALLHTFTPDFFKVHVSYLLYEFLPLIKCLIVWCVYVEWRQDSFKNINVTAIENSKGNLIIRYKSSLAVNFLWFLSYSFPLLHVNLTFTKLVYVYRRINNVTRAPCSLYSVTPSPGMYEYKKVDK
jgi:hypothetical protein